MIKLILMAVALLICIFSGVAVEAYFKARSAIINDYLAFIRYAKRETEFLKTDAEQLIKDYRSGSEFGKILERALTALKEGKPPICAADKLKPKANEEISAFFKGLTECDYYSKDALFAYSLSTAEELKRQSDKDLKQKGELIKKLTFLLGIGLVVLLI